MRHVRARIKNKASADVKVAKRSKLLRELASPWQFGSSHHTQKTSWCWQPCKKSVALWRSWASTCFLFFQANSNTALWALWCQKSINGIFAMVTAESFIFHTETGFSVFYSSRPRNPSHGTLPFTSIRSNGFCSLTCVGLSLSTSPRLFSCYLWDITPSCCLLPRPSLKPVGSAFSAVEHRIHLMSLK